MVPLGVEHIGKLPGSHGAGLHAWSLHSLSPETGTAPGGTVPPVPDAARLAEPVSRDARDGQPVGINDTGADILRRRIRHRVVECVVDRRHRRLSIERLKEIRKLELQWLHCDSWGSYNTVLYGDAPLLYESLQPACAVLLIFVM